MMNNVFEPVRVKGKLMGKNVATGQFATKDQIRHIQLLNAEKNREVLFVSATGRVTRVPAHSFKQKSHNAQRRCSRTLSDSLKW